MSNFDYHYSKGDKYPADDVINNLRDANDATKAEAVDWLIDKGFLHSDELYNAAYMLAMADAVGISYEGKYGDDDDEWNSEDEDEDTDSMMSWQLGLTPIPKAEEVQVDVFGDGEYDTSFIFYDWSLEQLREMAEKSPGWYSLGEEYLEYYDTTPEWPEPISYREWLIRRVREEGKDAFRRGRRGTNWLRPKWPPFSKTTPHGQEFSPHPYVPQSDRRYGRDAEDDKPVGNPKRLGRGVDWRPHEDSHLPSPHDRMRAEATVSSIYIVIDGYTQPIIWFGMTEEDMKIKLIEIIYGDNRFRYVSKGQLDERNEYDRKYGANAEKVTLEELVDEFNKSQPHSKLGLGTLAMKIEEYDPNDFYHDPTDKYPNAKVIDGDWVGWRAEYARGYTYERPLFMKVAGIGLLTAFALGLLRMDSKGDTTSNE